MATPPAGELNLATLRPKGQLRLRLMFDGFWKVLTLMGILFAAVGVGTIFMAQYFIALEKRYEREGKIAQGTVTDKDTYTTTETSGSGSNRRTYTKTHYRISYSFAASNGSKHTGRGNTSYGRWQEFKAGDPIEVQYLASEPETNRLPEEQTGGLVWLTILFPVVFGGAGVAMLLVSARFARKKALLLREGTLTRGVVEEKRERHDITINNRHPYDVTYTFALPDGEVHTGKELISDLKFAASLNPGDPVGIIYLRSEADKSTIFLDKWKKHFRSSAR